MIALIDESIKTENLMEKLYNLYSEKFPQHSKFFIQLSDEEKTHAALLSGGKKYFVPHKNFPDELLFPNLEKLQSFNSNFEEIIKIFQTTPPSIEEACGYAIKIERTGSEAEFNNAMNEVRDNKAIEIMKTLNKGFKNHAERIFRYSQNLKK